MKNTSDTLFHERVIDHLESISKRNVPEQEKLRAIGCIVEGTMIDLQEPFEKQDVRVRPSILPKPDNITINRMAGHQKKLRALGIPQTVQEEKKDQLLGYELMLQKNRTPGMSS